MNGKEVVKNYLEETCKTDDVLKAKYDAAVMDKCWQYIYDKAKDEAKGQNSCCIEDGVVFAWARHFYLEGLADEEKLKLAKEQEKKAAFEEQQKRIAEAKKKERAERKRQESGQISVFDLGA